MGGLILPTTIAIIVGALATAASALSRAWRAAGRDIYPGSPAHTQALARQRAAEAERRATWPHMTTAQQAAWDRHAIDTADADTRGGP